MFGCLLRLKLSVTFMPSCQVFIVEVSFSRKEERGMKVSLEVFAKSPKLIQPAAVKMVL